MYGNAPWIKNAFECNRLTQCGMASLAVTSNKTDDNTLSPSLFLNGLSWNDLYRCCVIVGDRMG